MVHILIMDCALRLRAPKSPTADGIVKHMLSLQKISKYKHKQCQRDNALNALIKGPLAEC